MKKYIKKEGNPSNDGLYVTDQGTCLFYKNEWYWNAKSQKTFMTCYDGNMPEFYFEEE